MDAAGFAIVTGAGSGLGRAICLALAARKWHIALADIAPAGAAETLEFVQDGGGSGQVEPLDILRLDQWSALASRLREQWPRLDLLVNNAGVAGAGEMGAMPAEDWDWVLDANLRGHIYGCHVCVEWLKSNPHGAHIINTASLAAVASAPAMGAYNVSKAGMLSLSETLYAELRKHKVGVTALCPAFFPTNLLTQGRFCTDQQKQIGANSMLRARFNAADVASAALRAMDKKRLYVFIPARARWYWRLKRLMPGIFMRVLARSYARGMPESV